MPTYDGPPGLERDTIDPDNQSIWYVAWGDTPITLNPQATRYVPPTRRQKAKRWLPNRIWALREDLSQQVWNLAEPTADLIRALARRIEPL